MLHLVRTALSMPPHVVARKAASLALRVLRNRLLGGLLRRQCTYPPPEQAGGRLVPRLPPLPVPLLEPHRVALTALAKRARDNCFDLLGSGWTKVERGVAHAGFGRWRYHNAQKLPVDWRAAVAAEGWPGNAAYAAALLAMIDDDSYRPIDWHVDFRSGYRWPLRTLGTSTAYGHKPGVDVKVPWELARLQHLAWYALVHAVRPDPVWPRTFRNQVLDFLAANPPGWGVNWACAMDVAIRAANLVLAWELFRAHGTTFDAAFEDELTSALLAHGRHVVHHLEWSPAHRGNHYLANLAGLAFIAAALPSSPESDLWLVFTIGQLDEEVRRQFGPDGANFEASTAYHRLSAELALHAVALVAGLPAERRAALARVDVGSWRRKPAARPLPAQWPPFGADTFDRLARAARFATDVTKPSGAIVQVGDNDSGRLFKLVPADDLDVGHLAAAAQGLFDLGEAPTPDTALVAALAGGFRRPVPARLPSRPRAAPVPDRQASTATEVVIEPADPTALDGMEAIAYDDFGLFLWRNARSFVSVRCGPIGGNGLGAHAHSDQLAVEIEIDGVPFARDPGTFVYTPDLAARNAYRSALAHFVPRWGRDEPARLDLGPFRLEDRAQACALRFAEHEFLGCHHGFAAVVWRRVRIDGGRVVIHDSIGGPMIAPDTPMSRHLIRRPEELAEAWGLTLPFSPGYGRQ